MLVAFDYQCPFHKSFEVFFDTVKYPNRNFPKRIACIFKSFASFRSGQMTIPCQHSAEMVLNTRGMQPDSYWSGKEIKSLGITVNSKDYLNRYCRTNNIIQLTDEELRTTKKKSKQQLIQEYVDRPDVAREREKIISESIDEYGVIDSVNMEK